ncbi:aminomethyltransferase, mitochondrial [Anthonomus grandis grandis]|uniref:aminomethyltransferase, mitochondrial n=1 Tax=Anthonomus grandis grandis TaxID=2921223 RepID=UPI0021656AA4|nr:aminomethyltransferase, mitochondrial [Anthonomus grandis grandis]
MNNVNKILIRNIAKRFYSSQKGEVTALYDFHVRNGGKIVNFGGFLLPVQYSDQSIISSHIFTRKNACVFDVSHMLQTELKGKNCVDFFESLCTADIKGLKDNSSSLTIFTDNNGRILDDLIVTKINNQHLHIVSNAAMREQDQKIIVCGLERYKKLTNPNAEIYIQFFNPLEKALIALQGPKASTALQKLTNIDLTKLYFMNTALSSILNVNDCRITRCGYTGEDGFELSVAANKVESIVMALLENSDVRMAGLGARDSLRLEAGLCLYGSDISADNTPVESALTWLVAKRRRDLRNFPGAEVILEQIKTGTRIKRIGLTTTSGPPPRHGAKILSEDGEVMGFVTSGCPSPTLGLNIAMGYVLSQFSKTGTKIGLKIRDKTYQGTVSKMPFVTPNYYNKPKV